MQFVKQILRSRVISFYSDSITKNSVGDNNLQFVIYKQIDGRSVKTSELIDCVRFSNMRRDTWRT